MALLQNIVKDLCKESRKGLTDGLREFIRIDNEVRPSKSDTLTQGMRDN